MQNKFLKNFLVVLTFLIAGSQISYAQQSNYPTGSALRVKEADGSPNVVPVTQLVFPNGSLTRNGTSVTITFSGSSGITVGTTTITSGTSGRVLYDNAGVVGEMTTSGTGTQLALTAGPTFTGTLAAATQTLSGTLSLTSTTAANNLITQGAAINIGTTSTDGIVLQNTTAAAAGAQQYSPRVRWVAQGWKTNATAGSQTVEWIAEVQPVQGTANPTSNLVFNNQVNGGGYSTPITFTSAGQVVAQSSGGFGFSGSTSASITAGSGASSAITITSGGASSIWLFGDRSQFRSGFYLSWTNDSSAAYNGSQDLFVRRKAAANLAIGDTDAASPVAQTLSVQNVVAGTSNTAGANWTHDGSIGTGTGVGGDIIFRTAPAGSTGTAQNSLAAALTVKGNGAVQLKSVTFSNLPTVANGYLIYCSDCTLASPCASGGTGALAKGINSAWVCN